MPHYPYLIVGAGMTADAAVRGIREVDSTAPIGIIGNEPDPPYNRPPLSKALWKGKPLDSVWRKTDELGVELHLKRSVRMIDPLNRRATDDTGAVYTFQKCLLATGGTPRLLPFGGDQIIYFRTLDDYRHLRSLADERQRFVVVGGGFIGSEIAAALAMNQKEATIIVPEQGIGARVFPTDLGRSLVEYYRQKGVEVLTGAAVTDVDERGERIGVQVRDRETGRARELVVDGVVAGIGLLPNVELARAAGLAVENGIVVDELLRTSHPDVFAAGDVAAFDNPALGNRIRVEHEDNANVMGRQAGRAIAGQAEPYRHLPFFYSDLFELGYEAVGEVDARLELVADWTEPYREGVVYYLRDGRVRGVLLWNVWDQVDAARRLIAEPGPVRPADLKGRLPESR
ncbi:MAG TPA: FAD-dependent oxidoreductase [Chloroflexota bacterium]|nr:FAD-dependent oxidoreductase [Chloroflexota bacterium]